MAILFITHDLGVIAEIADDVLVMYRGEEVEYGPVLEIFARPQAPVHEGPAGLPAAARHARTAVLPTVDDFMETRDRGRRSPRSSKRRWTPRGSSNSKTQGRGRLLASEDRSSPRWGIRGKQGKHAPDATDRRRRDRRRCLSVAEPASLLPGPPRHLRASRRPREGRRRHQLQRLSRPDAGPRRRIGLRQDDRRPRDPAAHRTDRRPRAATTASTSRRSAASDLREHARADADHLPGPLRLAQPADDDRDRRSPSRWSSTASARTRRDRRDRAAALLEEVGLQPALPAPLSARVLRRPAAAHLHRPRARRRAGVSSSATNRSRRSTSRCRPRCSTCSRTCRTNAA